MNAIRNILVPTDFSKTASLVLEHAAFMAKLFKADLYLLHVVEIHDSAFDIYNTGIIPKDTSAIQKAVLENLDGIAEKLGKEYSINVIAECITGSVTAEIANAVKDNSIDLVIMGTHGAHGFKEFFVGSNAYKTVNMCSCPVITVQTNIKKVGFTNIVLPIDDCFESRQKVDFTIAFAKTYAAKIHILGIMEEGSSNNSLEKFKIKLDSVEKAAKKAGINFTTKIIESNDLGLDTLRYARKVKADLISVLTDHESQYKGSLLGMFANKIINHSNVPILSIQFVELGVYDPVSLAGSNG
ncbi:MAG: universal stress protein [Bacteroidetes bacterium]|nr:universal stress protein [Bacteroidota bacterium]